jgi:hypothetical protein
MFSVKELMPPPRMSSSMEREKLEFLSHSIGPGLALTQMLDFRIKSQEQELGQEEVT